MHHRPTILALALIPVLLLASACGTDGSSDPDGAGGSACSEGAAQCNGTMVQLCRNGAWGMHEDCGDTGQVCNAGACRSSCTPETCASLNKGCGSWDDGCGGTLTCGPCNSGTWKPLSIAR